MPLYYNRLKEALDLRGIDSSLLSAMTGIRKVVICDWVNQLYQPKPEYLHVLANALKVSESWLGGYFPPHKTESPDRHSLLSESAKQLESEGYLEHIKYDVDEDIEWNLAYFSEEGIIEARDVTIHQEYIQHEK